MAKKTENQVLLRILDAISEATNDHDFFNVVNWEKVGNRKHLLVDGKSVVSKPTK